MKNRVSWIGAALAGQLLLAPAVSFAAVAYFEGVTPLKLKTYANDFGLCTITVDVNLNSDGNNNLSCGNTVNLSFVCGGLENPNTNETIVSKQAGNINWQAVQLAYVSGQKINFYAYDDFQLNGTVCYADRIIVRP